MIDIQEKIKAMPLISILRNIETKEIVPVIKILLESGFTTMEITLNSPNAFESINIANKYFGNEIALGAGTVLTEQEVILVKQAGGKFIISPNMNTDVIKKTKKENLLSIPGCYTPSEIITALEVGADIIKIFPADTLGVHYIKAIQNVLPENTKICPTGGIHTHNLKDFFQEAKVFAVGIGSHLYEKGKCDKILTKIAYELVKTFKKLISNP